MPLPNKEIVILSAARTPFGKFCGALKDLTATELGIIATRAALERGGIKPEEIDHVVFGNVLQTSADAVYLARHIGLKSGIPLSVPALAVNRLCGSGFQAIVSGAQLLLQEASYVLAGGTENMSQAPHVIRGARWGIPLGEGRMEDSLWSALTDSYCDPSIMASARFPAIKIALERAGLALDKIDLFEVNEAFAGQYLAVEKELGLDRKKVNVNGGAIAIGHPLGATGVRVTVTLTFELKRRNARFGIGSACIGGGQGIALLVERM